MTPMQIIILAHRMRQAQQAFQSSLKGESPLMDRLTVMADLEARFDAAIVPYINHAQHMEDADHEA
jgi:hypothetical protein